MPALLRAAAAQPGPAGPDCLDDETIATVVDGTVAMTMRNAATEHLASCARCRAAVASLIRALADTTVAGEIAALEGPRSRRATRFVLPALAAAAIVVLFVQRTDTRDDASRHRAPTLTSAAAPVPLAPVAKVAEARVLRWSAVTGADRYRVTLFDAAGRPVYEAQLADTVATLPDSIRLISGAPYLWTVDARIGWDRWASSPLAEFSVLRDPPR